MINWNWKSHVGLVEILGTKITNDSSLTEACNNGMLQWYYLITVWIMMSEFSRHAAAFLYRSPKIALNNTHRESKTFLDQIFGPILGCWVRMYYHYHYISLFTSLLRSSTPCFIFHLFFSYRCSFNHYVFIVFVSMIQLSAYLRTLNEMELKKTYIYFLF